MTSDEQRVKGLEDSMARILADFQNRLHTGCPAVVESYNEDEKRVDVRIPFREIYDVPDGTIREHGWPLIPDVPVKFPKSGGFIVTWPLEAGDIVWISWSMYPTGEWQASDGKTDVYQEAGRHLASDMFCDPDSPFLEKNNPGKSKPKSWYLQHVNGKIALELTPDGIANLTCNRLNIGSDSASTALAKANTVDDRLSALEAKYNEVVAVSAANGGFLPPGMITPIIPGPSTASGKAFTND